MIEDLLRCDAAAWQRDLDAGARPEPVRRRPDWRLLAAVAAVAAVLVVVAGIAAAVAVVRSRSHDTPPAGGLTGVRWVDPSSGSELTFSPRRVLLDDACHAEYYDYTMTDRSVTVVPNRPGAELSSCSGTPAQIRFDRFVLGTWAYVRSGMSLRLSRGGATLVLFERPIRTLTRTRWVLSHPVDWAGAPLVIDPDGTVRAGDHCGAVTGSAVVRGSATTGTAVAQSGTVEFRTRTDCHDPGFDPATRSIDTVLTHTAQWGIRGDTLFLAFGHTEIFYAAQDTLPKPVVRPPLTGVRWVDPATRSEVIFRKDSVRIDDGCLASDHRLTRTADTVTIGGEFGRGVSCGGTPGMKATRFDLLVRGTLTFRQTGRTLRLTRSGSSIVLQAKPLLHLAGTTWVMDAPLSGPVLIIGHDGRVQAGDGCGAVTGRARITESDELFASTVTFDTTVVPNLCPAPPRETPRIVDVLRSTAATYEIRRGELILEADNQTLTYHAR